MGLALRLFMRLCFLDFGLLVLPGCNLSHFPVATKAQRDKGSQRPTA